MKIKITVVCILLIVGICSTFIENGKSNITLNEMKLIAMASGDESSQCLKYCCYGDDDICQPGWNIRGVVTEVVPCDEDCSMLGY